MPPLFSKKKIGKRDVWVAAPLILLDFYRREAAGEHRLRKAEISMISEQTVKFALKLTNSYK